MTNFIFITGGVVSSLGKGVASASLGALLEARGYSVKLRKLDPYLNVDPGTMNPSQHGEVFVTEDGMEADLDIGHYERFTSFYAGKSDYTTSGQVYSTVLANERRGDYLGATVQTIPHITHEIKNRILADTEGVDFVLCEVGGTVGDIESLPFLEAIRQMRNDLGADRTLFVHVTLLPYLKAAKELKTKPTQHSVKELLSLGIQADILMCRCEEPSIDEGIKEKLSLFCNVKKERVISALNVDHIYKATLEYHKQGFDQQVCDYFKLPSKTPDLSKWKAFEHDLDNHENDITVAIVGKYMEVFDSYKSITEAFTHAGVNNKAKVSIKWVDAEKFETSDLKGCDGILVPGGFGNRGLNGKIKAIQYARENNIPFLGICLGMQLTIIEAARHQLGLIEAASTESIPETPHPVIGLLSDWDHNAGIGGTMRLGAYPCYLKSGSLAHKLYDADMVQERHRHRYEVNINYKKDLEEKAGLIFSGMDKDGQLTEVVERPDLKFFVACQFHPEFKSNPFKPSPLFDGLVKACL